MKIEIPDDVVAFLSDLAREISTQDNRATRSPYFYVVRGQSETCAPAGHGDVRYYVSDWGCSFEPDALREALKEHDEENGTKTDFDEFIREKCDEYSAAFVDVDDNVFLTFRGYNIHMELNGHNYRHLKDVHSYVKYAGRNPEMEMLLKSIMAFAEIETVKA